MKKIFSEEKAQGSIETLLVLGLAVVAAVAVGYFIKNFVTTGIQPQVTQRT